MVGSKSRTPVSPGGRGQCLRAIGQLDSLLDLPHRRAETSSFASRRNTFTVGQAFQPDLSGAENLTDTPQADSLTYWISHGH